MKENKTVFVCNQCGNISVKWKGRCPECGAWDSFEEELADRGSVKSAKAGDVAVPQKLHQLNVPEYIRKSTGISELDRVLGGGVVMGSVVLLSGEPGIGKSTLLMQMCDRLGQSGTILYVSGEESVTQLKLRADRLGIGDGDVYLLTETNTEAITEQCEKLSPDIVIIDSVQTLYSDKFTSAPGSVTQVKEAALALSVYAKKSNAAIFLVGHINKEGGISGPKTLEHMVDAVLYFEGERTQSYRIIRAIKNRYGSTNEIGVFEMGERGLTEIPNPSETMLAERPKGVSGSCAGCVMEGSRPIITEIQSLVSKTAYPSPKRTCDGFDYNRMCLLIAVLEKRMGLRFSECDVYLNVAGGLRLEEPGADLSVALSLISGMTDRVCPDDIIAFGEIGLAGEVRAVSHVEYRIKEALRLGFSRIIIPESCIGKRSHFLGKSEVKGISNIFQLLSFLSDKK